MLLKEVIVWSYLYPLSLEFDLGPLDAASFSFLVKADAIQPMETVFPPIRGRGRGIVVGDPGRGRPHSRNKHWTPGENARSNTPTHSDGERWERGGHRGGGRGSRGGGRGVPRKFPNVSLRVNQGSTKGKERATNESEAEVDVEAEHHVEEAMNEIDEPELETQEERERFYQDVGVVFFSKLLVAESFQLVKAREVERKKAIAEGKMDDPLVPKRLEDAISIVGTCHDMCPRFERYRRERENNLFEWETVRSSSNYYSLSIHLR